MSKAASNKITLYSFLFAILMVLYHFNPASNYTVYAAVGADRICEYIYQIFSKAGGYCVSFFFYLSGYLFYLNYSRETAAKKLSRRVRSLLIPLLLWNVIYFIVFNYSLVMSLDIKAIALGFLLSDFCGVLWYVEVLLIYAVLHRVIYFFIREKSLGIAFVIACIVLTLILEHTVDPTGAIGIWLMRACSYIPCYMIGSFIAVYRADFIEKSAKGAYKLAILLLLLITFIGFDTRIISWICGNANPILFWLLIDKESLQKIHVPNISFMIYVLHVGTYNVIYFFQNHFDIRYGTGETLAWHTILGYRLVMAGICILLTVLVIFIMKRLMPRVYNVLSGNR